MTVAIQKTRALGRLNLAPMIDVVFLLLIFFLVATKFEEEAQRQLEIVLPEAAEAMPLTARPKELFVNIDREGRAYVGSSAVSSDELLAAFQQAEANNPGRQTVIIRADRRCPFEFVVSVMDLCNQAKIRDYRVTTLPPK